MANPNEPTDAQKITAQLLEATRTVSHAVREHSNPDRRSAAIDRAREEIAKLKTLIEKAPSSASDKNRADLESLERQLAPVAQAAFDDKQPAVSKKSAHAIGNDFKSNPNQKN